MGVRIAITIGDFNGDGIPDIAAFGNFGPQIDVLLGDGAGRFQEASQIPTSVAGRNAGLTLADVNGDGILDIITCGSYLAGNGDGTFQDEQQFLSGFNSEAIAVTRFGGNLLFISADHTQTVVVTGMVAPATSGTGAAAVVSHTRSRVAQGRE